MSERVRPFAGLTRVAAAAMLAAALVSPAVAADLPANLPKATQKMKIGRAHV